MNSEKEDIAIRDAQKVVENFSKRNGWKDVPNIDKIDHLHEELVEISQYLRYKTEEERINFVEENKEIFEDEIGDLIFGLCRLSNQLGVDLEKAFNSTRKKVFEKYNHGGDENNIIRK